MNLPKLFIFLVILYPNFTSADKVQNFKQFQNCLKKNGIPSDAIISNITNSQRYFELTNQWNLRYPRINPLAFYIPTSTQDVQLCVWCGVKSAVHIVPKSGGHSYESFSFGSADTVVVDFRQMSQIQVNQAEKTAVIGPGALVGQIDYELWNSGGFGIPIGQCLTVGIGGHALGGGNGYFSHVYGLALDNLVELTMVDASGLVRTVNAQENPDLFWALRGIGPGYIGLVTSFKFKLFEASRNNYTLVKLHYDVEQMGEVLQSWQNWLVWVKANYPKIQSVMYIKKFNSISGMGPAGIDLHFLHIQDPIKQPEDNHIFLNKIPEFFPGTDITILHPINYLDVKFETGYAALRTNKTLRQLDLMNLRKESPQPRYFKERSFYVDKTFDADTLTGVTRAIQDMPQRNVYFIIVSEAGALHDVLANATAYSHRNSLYSIAVHYEGSNRASDVEEGLGWMQEFMTQSKFMDNGETYQNFVEVDLKDYLQRYFGDNLKRLVGIKRDWDPENYFQNWQSLPLALP